MIGLRENCQNDFNELPISFELNQESTSSVLGEPKKLKGNLNE